MYPGRVPRVIPEGARLRVYSIRSLDYTLPALTGQELAGIVRFPDELIPTPSNIRGIGYRGRLYLIPNGRSLALYDGTGPTDITSREKMLTFVGDFGPRKNQKYLVTMMEHLPNE